MAFADGRLYYRTEDVDSAKSTLTEIMERFPESNEAKTAKSLLRKIG